MGLLDTAWASFALGVGTPLTAVCVLPLYPGFLAYLSRTGRSDAGGDGANADGTGASGGDAPSVATLAALVATGVLAFMLLLGLAFTTLLEVGLTRVVGVVSPVAFAGLALLSLALLADLEPGRRLPTVAAPTTERPALSALGYGFFFGAFVVPCNPGFVAVFLGRALLFSDPAYSLANFFAFGAGIAAPLVGLALVSEPWADRVVGGLRRHRSAVNRATGAVMLAISVYYLVVVFDVLGVA